MPFETDFAWRAPGYVPDELLVKFKSGVATASAMTAIRNKGAEARRLLTREGLIQVKLPPGTRVEDVIEGWSALPEVEYAAPNAYAQGFFAPNDSVIGQFDLAWNLRNVGAYGAWDVVTGDPSIILAIIDTGVAFEDHPIPSYERPFLWPGTTMYRRSPELPNRFLPGYDFVYNDDHPNDDNGHGTMVSTIAAGQADNVAGSAGIAFGVTILPIKVLRWDTGGEMGPIVQGIRYAADQGANIANLSLGFPPVGQLLEREVPKSVLKDFFRPLKDAIHYAQNRGVIVVAAAGNFSYPELSLPAGYPGVISVGATGVDNQIASYSSWGGGLSYMAPGGDFTDLNEDHVQDAVANMSIKPFRSVGSLCKPDSFNTFFFFGSSGAAPHVSGAVALLMSLGIKSQGSIEQFLRSTAIKPFGKPSGFDPTYGFGLIQIDKAVQLASSRSAPKLAVGAPGRSGAHLITANPSRGSATLALRLSRAGPVRVQLFDVRGRLIRRLEEGQVPAGERLVRWDGKDDRGRMVGSGVYFFRVVTPDGVENRRVAVLR
jgi:serine protease